MRRQLSFSILRYCSYFTFLCVSLVHSSSTLAPPIRRQTSPTLTRIFLRVTDHRPGLSTHPRQIILSHAASSGYCDRSAIGNTAHCAFRVSNKVREVGQPSRLSWFQCTHICKLMLRVERTDGLAHERQGTVRHIITIPLCSSAPLAGAGLVQEDDLDSRTSRDRFAAAENGTDNEPIEEGGIRCSTGSVGETSREGVTAGRTGKS